MTISPLAQAVMVARCGWDPTLPITDGVEHLSGNGTDTVTLPSLYVTDVTNVVVTDRAGTSITYSSTDDPATIGPGKTSVGWEDNGVLTYHGFSFGGVWPVGQRNITVTYSGGYTSLPGDLAAALDSLTARLPAIGRTSAKIGTASFSYAAQVAAGGLLLVEEIVFDRYHIPRAA